MYSDSPEYREKVVSMILRSDSNYPILTDHVPIVSALRYHHLGIAVSDMSQSLAFYKKLGFLPTDNIPPICERGTIICTRNRGGMEIHFIQADGPLEDGKNILMDFPTNKPPGHTHASWAVSSVSGVRSYLEANGVVISGTRNNLAVFARDCDRTTLEFERNDGVDDAPSEFTPDLIGSGQPLDHVGIRVRAPFERHIEWYARYLGFKYLVNRYDPNPEPLKNNPPWITRSQSHCDINFIINCNTPIPEGGEHMEGALFAGGRLSPGIIYVGYTIAEDPTVAVSALRAEGVDAILDTDLESHKWGEFLPWVVRVNPVRPTVMVRDLNGNITRLVPE